MECTTRLRGTLYTFITVAALAALATPAFAAPSTVLVQGTVSSSGGGPVTDGSYAFAFNIYDSVKGGQAQWTEAGVPVAVSGGRFQHALGSLKALPAPLFATGKPLWLGVTLGAEPELPRQPLHAVPWALRAITANSATFAQGINCTGCVPMAALKFDGDLDLGGNAIKAKLAVLGSVTAGTVSAQSLAGDGSKITGIPKPQGKCAKGEAVVGIDATGKLLCEKVAQPIPGGALSQVSGGLLSNQFTDTFSSDKAVPIPDNNPIGAASTIVVPDIGLVDSLTIKIHVTNSNLQQTTITLFDPANAKYVLADKSVKGTTVKASFPVPNKPISGDLNSWKGKNPKGKWILKVVDQAFKNNTSDGAIQGWSVELHTTSTKKVQVNGDLVVNGKLQLPSKDGPCDADRRGAMRFLVEVGLEICDGVNWVAALPKPVFWQGGCSASGSNGWRYFCTDLTTYNTAGKYLTVAPTKSGTSTSNKTGRITFKIPGYYRVDMHSHGGSGTRTFEMYRSGSVFGTGSTGSVGNSSLAFSRVVRFSKGDWFNLRLYNNSGSSWNGGTASAKFTTYPRHAWLRVTYIGRDWKPAVCGDGQPDEGEECDDGNKKDDDNCTNKCVSNITSGVWSEVAPSSKNPTILLGTIPGKPGKKIKVVKLGICGDSRNSSGSNRFKISGGGLGFSWYAGQNNPGGTYKLSPTTSKNGSGYGFTYKTVNHIGQAGASLAVHWDYHYDWDGLYCHDTDSEGNSYKDTPSSVRAWVKYEYVN